MEVQNRIGFFSLAFWLKLWLLSVSKLETDHKIQNNICNKLPSKQLLYEIIKKIWS